MLTDEEDDGNAEKSDVVVVINCITRPERDNFEISCWEMAQCSIATLKMAIYDR